jgi:uracil-DNA glycosylase family 4
MASSYRSPLDKLMNHSCTRCELHEYTERVCVGGSGNYKSRIMLIGEAPGANEAETGRVFSGRAGQLLDLKLSEAGLDRDEVYVTNVVKCRPPDNRKPERPEWEACRKYLEREVRAVRPRFVLLLGNAALQTVARKSGITKQRGVRLDVKDPTWRGAQVMATIHPAYVLRNPGQDSVFSEDIRRFARLIRGDFQVVPVGAKYVGDVPALRRLKAYLLSLPSGTVVAYDVENRSRPWHEAEWAIVCLGLSVTGGASYVVPLGHPESPFRRRWKDVLRYLKPALERKDLKYTGQNAKHDNQQLAGAQVFMDHSFDIMLAAHLLDENRPKNLGFLSQAYLGADVYKGTVDLKPDKIMSEPLKKIMVYNATDTGYTRQLYNKLRAELLEEPRLTRLFAKLLMPGSSVLQQVEWRGMYVNQDRLWDRMLVLQDEVKEQREVLDEFNPKGSKFSRDGEFNYNSTQQLGRWLFSSEKRGGLGLSPLEQTKTGNNSTKEAVLLHYLEHPAVAALLRYRTLQLKWLNTYLVPWSVGLDARSRIHTTYKIYGTVTGRLSGDLQQVPRDMFIRGIIGARPGWRFVQADYSQIELRIAAHVAQERRMMRAYLTGEDLHMLTAMNLAGKSKDQVDKEERKKAKAVNFGFLYGMYPKKFQKYAFENYDMRVSMGEAELAREKYFEEFPDLIKWHDRQRRLANQNHRVSSPIGRIRHLPDILSNDRGVRMEAERQAINSPVQSCASDFMLFSMIKLAPLLDSREAAMVGTLHDGIFFEVREEKLDYYVPRIKEVMENLPLKKTFGLDFSVPIVADVSWGQHWVGNYCTIDGYEDEWEGEM